MLPEGIYLFSNGLDKIAKPFPASGGIAPHGWDDVRGSFGPFRLVEYKGLSFDFSGLNSSAPIAVCGECNSTMDVAAELFRLGLMPEWGSILTVSQRRGRGQLRREWISPAGNLYATLHWPSLQGSAWKHADVGLDSILFGWCFVEAAGTLGAELTLKWPNDLLQGNRKVAGLLMEDRLGATLAGIGMNLVFSPDDEALRRDAACPAGVVKFDSEFPSVLALWATLVDRAKNIYDNVLRNFTPHEFLTVVESRLAWMGQKVLVREGGESAYEGRLTGLNHDGGLKVARQGEEIIIRSGSILPV